MTGKAVKALLYTCRYPGHPTRNNETCSMPEKEYDCRGNHAMLMRAFKHFAMCPERSKLVVELDNGTEISFIPTLREDCPAMGEAGSNRESPVMWDMTVEVWP